MANDLGLGLPYALQGLDHVLAQRKAEQIQAEQRAQAFRQQQFENGLKIQNERRLEDVMKGQQADRQAARQEQDFTRAGQINQAMPEGSFLQQGDPAVGMMQKAGYGGFLKSAPAIAAQGQDFQGPTENASIQDYQDGRPGGFVKTATAQQLAEQAKEKVAQQREQQVIDNQTTQDKRLQADQTERARHNRAMENKPVSGGVMVVDTVDENGNKVRKVVPKTAGASYVSPPSATEQTRLDSAHAVIQTGDDMVNHLSDPAFSSKLGPALGRYNTMRDFIGNPPPEFSELAGQVESYALANMGVHGMRSAEGAKQIAALLDQHHTPESLAATIRGLSGFARHFTENKGQKTPGATTPKAATAGPAAAAAPATRIVYDMNGNVVKQ